MSRIRRVTLIAIAISLICTGLSFMVVRGESKPICLIEDCAVTRSYGYPMVSLKVDRYEGLNCGTLNNPKRTDSSCGPQRSIVALGLFANALFYFAIAFGAVYIGGTLAKKPHR